jgi:serine/threonine protein kinase
MAAPTNVDELLELIQKSGVVEEKRQTGYLDRLRQNGALPSEPAQLAAAMVRDGLITNFQCEQFLQGKWKRFCIGKYKVLERLGSGGMGSVYLCEHKLMRRRVAVKILPHAKAEDPAALERFYREARAVAALDHPNVVRAFDIDQDDKLHFLVMEFVDGSSLQDVVKKSGPLDPMRSAHYMRQAALGLQHAHESAGLVHRDIKPGNVLVDRNGIVKILDMGLARFFHDEEDILTKKYDENVLGTADYLAPEQALDSHSVDIRADIYSLGATFYYCLTGRTPFSEGTVAQKLIWHQTRQPKSIRTIRPEVPEELVAVIERMMSKDPSQRYQTPTAVADVLEPFTQTSIPLPPDSEMPQLSLAALPPAGAEGNPSGDAKSPSLSDVSSLSLPRKQWQVAGTPASAAPIVVPASPARVVPVPTVKPVAPAARAAAPPEVRPIAPSHARVVPRPVRSTNPPVVTPRKPAARRAPANNKPAPETNASSPRTPPNHSTVRRPTSKPATKAFALPAPKRLRITPRMMAAAGAGALLLLILIIWLAMR